ncbi:tRNA1(Val) (adenine(37)-N6)-methyltransferase [Paracoccus pacificus]|uniref:tRNA1(Val) (Adenine(37)-N6)-methyltransferase n=1 Tax=Paracoccus pacificus TaxID=1463598 RepID=A0ABW4R1Q9_9RHOB
MASKVEKTGPETRVDGFLGGKLAIEQPVSGYRAGADAVMLAAAVPARTGDRVLEPGCGAGAVSLCLGHRVPGLALTGIELQPEYAALARQNAARNAIDLRVVTADLTDLPAGLRAETFDLAMMNPPYFDGRDTASPGQGRDLARRESLSLTAWADATLRRLRPGGRLIMIHRAARMADLLAAVQTRAGAIRILPLTARQGHPAGRVILGAVKGARGALQLLSPLVLHAAERHLRDGEDLSPQASAILRDGAPLNLWA